MTVEPTPAITPMQMLQMAVEQGADLDKLTKLMDLQERWEASQARKAYVVAETAFKADPPRITKNKHVSFRTQKGQTEYDHATLDEVCDVVGTALALHGLSHRWEIKQHENAAIEVTCVLTHEQGHSERTTLGGMPDDSGGKNLIQQIASTVTYLQRYTLLAATGLAPGEQDRDGGAPIEPISAEQKARLIELMKDVEADTEKFLNYLGVETLDELPTTLFDSAIAALEKKRTA
ncbi:MAG: ERF family protein [Geminicoccaceae bacterium]